MKTKNYKQVILLALTITITAFLSVQIQLSYAQDLTIELKELDNSINQAFVNVSVIEKSGLDISSLVLRLNAASNLLSQAQNTYASGDHLSALSSIEAAQKIVEQINVDTTKLLEESLAVSRNQILISIGILIFSSAIIVISLTLFWKKFKRLYFKRLLQNKPRLP